MSFDSLLVQTYRTQRRSLSGTDSYGQPVYTWAAHLEGNCRLQPRRGTAAEVADIHGEKMVSTHRAYCRLADITAGDKIWVSGGYGGPTVAAIEREFDILSVSNAAGHEHHLQLELKAIEPTQA